MYNKKAIFVYDIKIIEYNIIIPFYNKLKIKIKTNHI